MILLKTGWIEQGFLEDGKTDGLVGLYYQDGTLQYRENYKEGELLGRCYEPGCTDFN